VFDAVFILVGFFVVVGVLVLLSKNVDVLILSTDVDVPDGILNLLLPPSLGIPFPSGSRKFLTLLPALLKVTAPKSDQEKKVEAGATVIATKSGGRIVTTPTMDNKSLIMSKATQDKTKFDYLRASKNYGSAKPAIGKAISGGQAVRLSQLANKTGGTPATSTRLSQLGSKTGGTPLTAKPNVLSKRTGGALDKDTGIPKVNTAQLQSKTGSSPTLLRGNNQTLKSGGQFGSLQERTFLKTSTKAGRSLANPSIGPSLAYVDGFILASDFAMFCESIFVLRSAPANLLLGAIGIGFDFF
jgi:hypothetical protein